MEFDCTLSLISYVLQYSAEEECLILLLTALSNDAKLCVIHFCVNDVSRYVKGASHQWRFVDAHGMSNLRFNMEIDTKILN